MQRREDEAGTPNRFILEQAVELDAGNIRAKKLLDSLQRKAEQEESHVMRYAAAIAIAVLALLLLILLAKPRKTTT